MSDLASVQIAVYGLVQGVFFRYFTEQKARQLGLTGYVRNLPQEGTVEVRAEGERNKLETLINYLKVGPPTAKVTDVITKWSEYTGSYSAFHIRH
jgi:acylphosphatase